MDFFIGGAIYTTVVKFNLGHWTWIVVAFCIGIVYLRNEVEQIVSIPVASIEIRKDEDVELRIQGSQIGIGQLPNEVGEQVMEGVNQMFETVDFKTRRIQTFQLIHRLLQIRYAKMQIP